MIVERDEVLNQLALLLAVCAEGRGATAVISGGVGFGKSTLLETLTDRAAARGHTVLSAVGSRDERGFAYGVLGQLLQGCDLAGGNASLSLLLERAAGASSMRPVPSSARVMHASHRMLVDLSTRRPVVISVDDVQFCDPQSLQCLLYLIRRSRRLPVTILLTHRIPGITEWQEALAELTCRAGILHVQLGPLSEAGVKQLITHRLGAPYADRHIESYQEVSGGNPVLLRALLNDHAAQAGRTPEAVYGPVTGDLFQETALACVHRSGQEALQVARGLAVLDGYDSPPVLAQLIELEERTVTTSLKILNESKIVNGACFRHSAIRTAILDDTPAEERARFHRRAGWLLRQEGAPAITVAPHLIATGPIQEDWAVRLLMEAQEQAIVDDQVHLATECLKLAGRCAQGRLERHQITMKHARILWRDSPESSTRLLQTLVGSARTGMLPPRSMTQLSTALLERGKVHDAVSVLERLDVPTEGTDRRLQFDLDVIRLWLSCTFPEAADHMAPSLAKPSSKGTRPMPTVGAPRLSAKRALWAALTRNADDTTVAEVNRVLHSVSVGDEQIETLVSAVMTLVYMDRAKAAADWCDLLLAKAAERRASTWTATLTGTRALISLHMGELRSALSRANTALDSLSRQSWSAGIALPLATAIEAATAMGQHDIADELVNRLLPPDTFQTRYGLHYLYARGRHHLAGGQQSAALADFVACGEKMQTWGLDCPVLAPWRLGAAEAWLRFGKRDRAIKCLNEHLTLVDPSQGRSFGIALRALAALQASPAQQVQLLTQSSEALQPTGNRCELALTLAELGRAHQRQGAIGKARVVIRQAWHMAKACGAEELGSSLVPEPVKIPRPESPSLMRGPDEVVQLLSDAEIRVTSLAAQGYTNREISSKLFITVSTVEQHLTRAYRKLNIRHRHELSARFAM
jgi:DNA-binding CsgD family transcriptional regulator